MNPMNSSWQNYVSAFLIHCLGLSFPSKEQVSFNFMVGPTVGPVILEPKKINSVIASTFSSSIWHEVMGPDAI